MSLAETLTEAEVCIIFLVVWCVTVACRYHAGTALVVRRERADLSGA